MDAVGFCDLCINVKNTNEDELIKTLHKLSRLGYKTVAINQNIDESVFDNEKSKKKKKEASAPVAIPDPMNLDNVNKIFKGKLNILTRLTYSFTEASKTYRLNQSSVLKNCNIYACVPKTQNALQFACGQLNADIIYINSSCNGLRLNRKLYLQAVNRGLHFEIQYGDMINLETRKFAIHWTHLFYTYGKSRNVIISSGADDEFFLRNPYDVMMLASVFGLQGEKAQAALLSQCHKLLYKAERRVMGKSIISLKEPEVEETKPKKLKLKP